LLSSQVDGRWGGGDRVAATGLVFAYWLGRGGAGRGGVARGAGRLAGGFFGPKRASGVFRFGEMHVLGVGDPERAFFGSAWV